MKSKYNTYTLQNATKNLEVPARKPASEGFTPGAFSGVN